MPTRDPRVAALGGSQPSQPIRCGPYRPAWADIKRSASRSHAGKCEDDRRPCGQSYGISPGLESLGPSAVGETQTRKIDVRVISATNLDLSQEVKEKRFREDLYYRVSAFPIEIPPLRERRSDIPELASLFLRRLRDRSGKPLSPLSPEALDRLSNYPWPGNVRELENEMERAAALVVDGNPIGPELLSERIRLASFTPEVLPSSKLSLKQARARFERDFIAEVLKGHAGNATRAAQSLGISRQMLQRKIKAYSLR